MMLLIEKFYIIFRVDTLGCFKSLLCASMGKKTQSPSYKNNDKNSNI